MATIKIYPDSEDRHYAIVVDINAEILTDEDAEMPDPWWVASCTCGVQGTDRGNFEDTTQWALTHVEGAHE
jgi:hypothetical protein